MGYRLQEPAGEPYEPAIDLRSLSQELWREDGQVVGDPWFKDFPPESTKTRILGTSKDRMLADALTQRITEHGPVEDLMHGKTVNFDANTRPENSQRCETRSF